MKDNIRWELLRWFSPVWQEWINIRFFVLWLTVSIILMFVNLYASVIWLFGFLVFGYVLAAKLGMFDID